MTTIITHQQNLTCWLLDKANYTEEWRERFKNSLLSNFFENKKLLIKSANDWLSQKETLLLGYLSLGPLKAPWDDYANYSSRNFDIFVDVGTNCDRLAVIVRKFLEIGNPIILLINNTGNHWYTCVMTKKGLFWADSFHDHNDDEFYDLYDKLLGIKSLDPSKELALSKQTDYINNLLYIGNNRKTQLKNFLNSFSPTKQDFQKFKEKNPKLFKTKEK